MFFEAFNLLECHLFVLQNPKSEFDDSQSSDDGDDDLEKLPSPVMSLGGAGGGIGMRLKQKPLFTICEGSEESPSCSPSCVGGGSTMGGGSVMGGSSMGGGSVMGGSSMGSSGPGSSMGGSGPSSIDGNILGRNSPRFFPNEGNHYFLKPMKTIPNTIPNTIPSSGEFSGNKKVGVKESSRDAKKDKDTNKDAKETKRGRSKKREKKRRKRSASSSGESGKMGSRGD